MLLLVSGATTTVRRLHPHPNLGVLLTPVASNDPPPVGVTFACDNSCYSGFDAEKYIKMLRKLTERRDCLWVTCPDVVGDPHATAQLWNEWAPVVRDFGQQPALVAQDGIQPGDVPWDEVGAVFIGGSTEWKLGLAHQVAEAANARGVWVHMGRVNSRKRLRYAYNIGVRSVDGSKYSMFPDTWIPSDLAYIANLTKQQTLWGSPRVFPEGVDAHGGLHQDR